MGVFYSDHNTYIIKYRNDQLENLKKIFENTYHYFYDYSNNKWKYIENEDEIQKFFIDEEFEELLEERDIDIDNDKKTISLSGIYIREHGEGTHLEINEDYLIKNIFDFDSSIRIIKINDYQSDYDDHSCYINNMLIYMDQNQIKTIYLNSNLNIFMEDIDEVIDSSDLKYFISKKNINNIKYCINEISKYNIFNYYLMVKDKVNDEELIEFVKKDFINMIDKVDLNIADRILKNDKIMTDAIKSISFEDLELINDNYAEYIINNREYIIQILKNVKSPLLFFNIDTIFKDEESKAIIKELNGDYNILLGDKLERLKYKFLSKYKNDKDIILILINNHYFRYKDLPNNFKKDKDIILELMKYGYGVYEYLPYELQIDKDIVNALLKINTYELCIIFKSLRNNEQLFIELMKYDKRILKYASKTIREKYSYQELGLNKNKIDSLNSESHKFTKKKITKNNDIKDSVGEQLSLF